MNAFVLQIGRVEGTGSPSKERNRFFTAIDSTEKRLYKIKMSNKE
jgi:hypothetical protein